VGVTAGAGDVSVTVTLHVEGMLTNTGVVQVSVVVEDLPSIPKLRTVLVLV